MTDARAKVAYDTFRSGFGSSPPVPEWENAPPWLRDVAHVAYLQGKIDGSGMFEKIETAKLCRAFGVSADEAKQALDNIGFMYRQLASVPEL